MSHKTSVRVWEHSQTQRAARCLMLALADFANDDGICWPGTVLLSKRINELEDYTDVIIKKCVEMGELEKYAGRGRGNPSCFAILCGLTPDEQKKLKGVLQKGYPSTPFEKRGTAKGVIIPHKRGTFSDANYRANGASERSKTPIIENDNQHDPIDDGGGGRTLAFLEAEGIGAAQEFAHFPFEPMRLDFNNRIAAGQSIPIIVKAWRRNPPTEAYHYEQRPIQPDAAPDRPQRSVAKGINSQFGSGQSDVKDPGWRERLIKQAENGELP